MPLLADIYGKTALVTGASSGFGREFARELAQERFENIVVVARRKDRLEALAKELADAHGTRVVVVVQDLSEPGAVHNVMDRVQAEGLGVDVLVNNAGVGVYGWFGDSDIARELAMVDLNSKVPVELAHRCLPHMKAQKRGGILNISGLMDEVKAGTFSTYCGTKAFVSTFSQCLNEELHGTGVDVVCLSPGYNPDTEIFEKAGVPGTFPFPRGNPNAVARHGIRLLKKKRPLAVNGVLNKLLAQSLKFTPVRVRQLINKKLVGTPEERRKRA